MKMIPLTQGKVALVDDGDYESLSKYKWYTHRNAKGKFYAARNINVNGKRKTLRMHVSILGKVDGMMIDHINGSTVDNRRCNLRRCTNAENLRNRGATKSNKSGFKGVTWRNKNNKWHSYIRYNGRAIHLGYFTCLVKAAKAYDEAARRLFGEFANTNFKEECNV